MTLLWLVTGASLLAALVAWGQARRAVRRLEQLSQMYWELKYQHGELRAQVDRAVGHPAPATDPASGVPRATGNAAFVPLASLKR
jgi:hypothetical protein